MANRSYDVIILGSGPAGYTAAIYATRAGRRVAMLTGPLVGGQLTTANTVDDFPGFPEGVKGPELMKRMHNQAGRFGTNFIDEVATAVDLKSRPFKIVAGELELSARSVIIATGASARWLGLPSEKRLIGKGVSSCALCDGYFFKGKPVAVVGGGDTAIREALYLANIASEVIVIHRRDQLRAQKALQELAFANKKIRFVWNSVVEEVLGKQKVEGLKVKDVSTGKFSLLKIDGVFIAVGHDPNTGFLKGQVELDAKGYVVVHDEVKSSADGVFAAGDCADYTYMQAITAAGAGAKAAIAADRWLAGSQ